MNSKIDFGTIGVKIGDTIIFEHTKTKYIVGSGEGTPGNGGTLIIWETEGLRSIKSATRHLMGTEYNEDLDLFSLWTFKGQTLRDLYKKNNHAEKDKNS